MRELTISEMDLISGGINYEQVGVGLGSVALGITIAATPVGWVGIAGAVALSAFGGFTIGSGFMDGNDYHDGTLYD